MDYIGLWNTMFAIAKKKPDIAVCRDLSDLIVNWAKAEPANNTPYKLASTALNLESHVMRYYAEKNKFQEADQVRDLIYRTLKFSAPKNFDHYMQCMEFNRAPEERFYLPRRKVLFGHVQALQKAADREINELFLSQPPRTGKALANDTPVLTRHGWKNHGDLKVGDEVIGMSGEFKKVIAVHPKCMLDVLVEFTNGEKIQCHENHEWKLIDHGNRMKLTLQETKYFEKRKLDSGEPGHRGHRYIFQLPERAYVQGEEKDLPLDPYVLGVWLGDGTNQEPRICCAQSDIAVVERVERSGIVRRWHTVHKDTGVLYFAYDMRPQLQQLGMCFSRRRTDKHIPEEYLTASVRQRLELLAGLLDTDGTFRESENRYVFTTCEESLRDTFIELISTFGWRPCLVTYPPSVSSSGIEGRHNTYCIGFNPDCEIPCELPRKQNHSFSKRRAVSVKNITRVEPKEGNCITVEGDGMYLAGKTMLPTHNTSLVTFFYTWEFGRNPERSNLYVSYSDALTNAFYGGLLEVMEDSHTYNWQEIFPTQQIVNKNAKNETLDVGRVKKYPTMTCRSLFGTLNGSTNCDNILVADDLLSGIEEALNPDRLLKTWMTVENNMLSRAKMQACVIWIGTRWSVADPMGRRIDALQHDPKFRKIIKYKVINIPALNSKDESNFEYDYNVGFSTDYYRAKRASFEAANDLVSWSAQYMGTPIEREGTLFKPDNMKYFNGVLPEGEPDRVFCAVDPAFGGGDFTAAPIVYQYKDEFYVVDVIYSDQNKRFTQPLIAKKAQKHGITAMRIEATKATQPYVQGVQEEMDKLGYHLTIQTKSAPPNTSKEQRIFDKSADIMSYFLFLDMSHRSNDYNLFMQNVFSFKLTGRNKHDDAPDSLAMTCEMAFERSLFKARAFRRPC